MCFNISMVKILIFDYETFLSTLYYTFLNVEFEDAGAFGNCTLLTDDELYFDFGERIEIGDVDKCIVFDCFLFPASTIS